MASEHENKIIPTLIFASAELATARTPGEVLTCSCNNDCGSHPEAVKCMDFATAAYSIASGVLKSICVECAVELVKKVLMS